MAGERERSTVYLLLVPQSKNLIHIIFLIGFHNKASAQTNTRIRIY